MMNNYKGISNLVIVGNEANYRSIEEETTMFYTMNDAHELIKQIGMRGFLEALYQEKAGRLLTVEEQEAMQVLHDSWEL